MSAFYERAVILVCDGCGDDHVFHLTLREARALLAADGWVRRRPGIEGGGLRDICPDCQGKGR
jgi:hypothetical protein